MRCASARPQRGRSRLPPSESTQEPSQAETWTGQQASKRRPPHRERATRSRPRGLAYLGTDHVLEIGEVEAARLVAQRPVLPRRRRAAASRRVAADRGIDARRCPAVSAVRRKRWAQETRNTPNAARARVLVLAQAVAFISLTGTLGRCGFFPTEPPPPLTPLTHFSLRGPGTLTRP